jgi:sensor histidine kinase YesM
VTQHDFIFSDRLRHRITRHAAFLLVCWIFFCVSFYLPFKVFPAWNTDAFARNVPRLGLARWLTLRFVNSLIIFFPLVAFAYVVIYFTLPRYFFSKKNRLTATVLFAGIFMIVLLAQYGSGWLVAFNWSKAGPGRKMLAPNVIISQNINIILLNYPVVVGFAVIIKMMKRSWLKQQETLQVSREKAKAELQLLKSQIHPHFLFNTLNNVYYLTLTASEKAPEMLEKLTDMLRYILNECNRPYVSLEKEIKMVTDYMALEKIRYGGGLNMHLEIKGSYTNKLISPLLLIPLVENSFKHGASKMLVQPWVRLSITIEGQNLLFLLSNSRPEEAIPVKYNGHIGLNNVKKRLQLLYPEAHELSIVSGAGSYEVFLKIHLSHAGVVDEEIDVQTERLSYELA